MDSKLRDFFDRHLETVLSGLPARVLSLLDEVPLIVEDYPSDEVLRTMGIEDREQLCGLYTGVPLTDRRIDGPVENPDAVTIYREGIMNAACNERGYLTEKELLRQIRITVLHELGHHHGLDEDDLDELGYG